METAGPAGGRNSGEARASRWLRAPAFEMTVRAMNAPGQRAATWPQRICRVLLTVVSLFVLGLACVVLLFALLVLPPAWDSGLTENFFVWLITLVGVPLLVVQLVFGIVLVLLRKRLAPLRAALVLSALAMMANLGAQAGVVGFVVHNDRLAAQAYAADAAAVAGLEQAVQAGDVARARTLLGDLRMVTLFTGRPAAQVLGAVIDRKDLAMLTMLLEKCPSLPYSASPNKAAGPLHRAAAVGDVEIARLLIDKGFKVNQGDAAYKTPLAYATASDRTEMAEFLASRGALPKDRAAKVLDAAASGDGAAVRRFVEEGVDANTSQGWGQTLLHYAAGAGDRETAELLLGKGSDVHARNQAGETPLHVAARRNQAEMIRLLVSKGADVGAKSRAGYTALDYAREGGCQEAAKALEELIAQRRTHREQKQDDRFAA